MAKAAAWVQHGYVFADKEYDSQAVLDAVKLTGGKAVLPPRKNRKKQQKYAMRHYKMRNAIERTFGLLKQFSRVVTTTGERDKTLSASWLWLLLLYDKMLVGTAWPRLWILLTHKRKDKTRPTWYLKGGAPKAKKYSTRYFAKNKKLA